MYISTKLIKNDNSMTMNNYVCCRLLHFTWVVCAKTSGFHICVAQICIL